MSLRAIRSHPLRSALTTLGVLIGVAAVISLVILGASLQAEVIDEVGGEDATQIYLWNAPEDAQGPPGSGARAVFTESDIDELRGINGVEGVAPYAPIGVDSLGHGGDTVAGGDTIATDPSYFAEEAIAEGRAFEQGEPEIVLTPQAAEGFDEEPAVGDQVTITFDDGSEAELTVVGILDSSEARSPFDGFGEGSRLYVPTEPYSRTTTESVGDEQRADPADRVVARRELLDVHRRLAGEHQRPERVGGGNRRLEAGPGLRQPRGDASRHRCRPSPSRRRRSR